MSAMVGERQTKLFNMIAQKQALKLEINGLRHSRGSVYQQIKNQYGLRGNKLSVYTQFCELVEREKQFV